MKEVKIKAWVARDEDGVIRLFKQKPILDSYDASDYYTRYFWTTTDDDEYISLPENSFPEVKISDPEPTEVELTIKIK